MIHFIQKGLAVSGLISLSVYADEIAMLPHISGSCQEDPPLLEIKNILDKTTHETKDLKTIYDTVYDLKSKKEATLSFAPQLLQLLIELKKFPEFRDPKKSDLVSATRTEIIHALSSMGPQVIPLLIPEIEQTEDDLHAFHALTALGKIGPEAVPFLLKTFKENKDPHLRVWAATYMSRWVDHFHEIVPALVQGLQDPVVRLASAKSLAFIGEKAHEMAQDIYQFFNNKDGPKDVGLVRDPLAEALIKMKKYLSPEMLTQVEDYFQRKAAEEKQEINRQEEEFQNSRYRRNEEENTYQPPGNWF